MVSYNSKRLLVNIFLKKRLSVYNNSTFIHKNFVGNKFYLSRGLYGRYVFVYKENIGLRFGSFISTRKFLNKPVYKKKR